MIEKAIHEILGDDQINDAVDLLALLPIGRIVTGVNHDRNFPYASVNLESDLVEYRSNKGAKRKPSIRFQVWHEDHAAGKRISNAIEKLFESKTFTTDDFVLETRHENSIPTQEPDGTWQFLIDIDVKATSRN